MTLFPLLVVRQSTVIYTALAHEKSAEKTLETNMLWEVHPSTQRVIPVEPRIDIERVRCAGTWYVAYVSTDAEHSQTKLALEEAETLVYSEGCKIHLREKVLSDFLPEKQAEDKTDRGYTHHNNAVFLHTLYDLVAQRNSMRPQGSYTSHLFASGGAKIRKKLGEEAIEVILAESNKELSLEVADLLYHLIVLLVHNGISLEACIEVLHRRHA